MPKTPASDRRSTARYPVGNAVADCRRLPLAFFHPNIADRLLDVSAGGARLVTVQGLNPGQQVRVRIEFPGTTEKIDAAARVVWSYDGRRRTPNETTHVVGLDFLIEPDRVEATLQRVKNPRARTFGKITARR